MNELTTTAPLASTSKVDHNPALVYLAGLAESSRRPMGESLAIVADLLTGQRSLAIDWPGLRFQHVALIRSSLAERYAPATANRILCALRGTLKAAWRLGQMTADEYRAAADVKNVKGETVPAGRSLSPGELAALLDACGPDRAGVRDAAIIALLYACGLRRAELVTLALADYDPAGGSLRIMGKGRKERLVYPEAGASAALADWLSIRGDWPGPLFVSINKADRLGRGMMTTQAVYAILQARAAAAGVTDVSPHDMRRTFVSDLLDAGADIATVQKMAGHSSVVTTARYDRRGEATKKAAAGLLHVPYRRRVLAR